MTTRFIEENPRLVRYNASENRGEKVLRYLANVAVNGPEKTLGATGMCCIYHLTPEYTAYCSTTGPPPALVDPAAPFTPVSRGDGQAHPQAYLYNIYKTEGPEAFAKAVRAEKKLLMTDTTWRDAHQSLLATRVRTADILAAAPATREV